MYLIGGAELAGNRLTIVPGVFSDATFSIVLASARGTSGNRMDPFPKGVLSRRPSMRISYVIGRNGVWSMPEIAARNAIDVDQSAIRIRPKIKTC